MEPHFQEPWLLRSPGKLFLRKFCYLSKYCQKVSHALSLHHQQDPPLCSLSRAWSDFPWLLPHLSLSPSTSTPCRDFLQGSKLSECKPQEKGRDAFRQLLQQKSPLRPVTQRTWPPFWNKGEANKKCRDKQNLN